jgi:Rps23 Pro-64 3,4-dihydroxylase Tpa1-like proline 4-hydroxylase
VDRKQIADLIVARLVDAKISIAQEYQASWHRIGHFVIDDLLPEALAREIFACFPDTRSMRLKKSLKEYKYIAAQMNLYKPILEEVIYAFQDARVVRFIADICGLKSLAPDEHLYAGGISLMSHQHFLNPHLDNSHDKERERWRVFNLLYYVTPDWQLHDGGNLELWPNGPKQEPITIPSKFNRLAVMATHEASWHSVSPIQRPDRNRCCVSNYYFSDTPLRAGENFHVTSFRGRPEQAARDLVLRADIALRMGLRRMFKKGIVENPHVYKK